MRRIALAIVFLFIMTGLSFGVPGTKTWKAVWTANTETDLSHYWLYWRTNGGTFNDTDRVQVAGTEQTLTGVVPNSRFIAVTAEDTSGNESDFSSEIFFEKDSSAPGAVDGLSIIEE